ncbi:MAG: hypothetical protein LBR80_02355 [Deltaproteobacteria bacterium]|jgi:hypothetical protein|nr:hypothetical protein [Deltaproteobacteria bacterium]
MFSRIRSRTDPRRLGETYSRWDFALALIQRVVEAAYIVCLLFFLGDAIWRLGESMAPQAAGRVVASLLLVLAFGIARLPVGLLRSSLDSAFGVDPRRWRERASAGLWHFLALLPVGAAGTLALLATIPVMGPFAWGGIALALVWLATALWLLKPRVAILSDRNLRPPEAGEIPAGAERYLSLLSATRASGLGPGDVVVSTAFYPGLPVPFPMAGKLMVPERDLAAFPPNALAAGMAAAALCREVSSGRSLAILRFFSVSLAVPASLILLNSVGILFGYPIVVRPCLAALFWAGIWAAFWFSEFATLFVERTISARVSAAVAALTMDAKGLFESVEITARGNLDPSGPAPILDLFRPRQNPVSQFEAIKRSVQEMMDAAAKRRSDAVTVAAASAGRAIPGQAVGSNGRGKGSEAGAPTDGGPPDVKGEASRAAGEEGQAWAGLAEPGKDGYKN